MVNRSRRVCEGCWFEPSPALITGTGDTSAASLAAPSWWCLITSASAYDVMMRIESAKVSPFLAREVLPASENPITRPPKRWIAVSNDSLGLVEASKKQLATILFLRRSVRGLDFNSWAVWIISSRSSRENSDIEMMSFWNKLFAIIFSWFD